LGLILDGRWSMVREHHHSYHLQSPISNLHNKQQKRNSKFTIQFNSRSILIESNSHGRSNVQRFTLGTNHSTTPCRPSHNNNDSDHPRSPDTLCCTTNHSFLPHQTLPFTFTATAASKSNQHPPEEYTETNSSIQIETDNSNTQKAAIANLPCGSSRKKSFHFPSASIEFTPNPTKRLSATSSRSGCHRSGCQLDGCPMGHDSG